MAGERLQKFLASAGVTSRRKAEALILDGRVKVNEAVVRQLGTKVDPARDLVTVDGKLVSAPDDRAYYLLYKPPGCVTTASDPEGRPTALDYLRGVRERVFPVGRLDFDAEGALLFTNDGELANRLAHPRYGHRRVYLVKVKGDPEPEALRRMVAGVRLEDGPANALEAAVHERAEKNVWVRVVVSEGRFHLVKRLCEAVGLQVQRLFRPEFGGITVERLRPGAFRALDAQEIRAMKHSVGLTPGEAAKAGRGVAVSALPKAARRHGHGPPAPPPSDAERAAAAERAPEAAGRREGRPVGRDRGAERSGGAGRGSDRGDRRAARPGGPGRGRAAPEAAGRREGGPFGRDDRGAERSGGAGRGNDRGDRRTARRGGPGRGGSGRGDGGRGGGERGDGGRGGGGRGARPGPRGRGR